MISSIPRELCDITKGCDVHKLLIQIISELIDSSYSIRLNNKYFMGIHPFEKDIDQKSIILLDVIILKKGEWISDIGGKYHENCYRISYSYDFRYYYHTITETSLLGWIRDSKINQLLDN